MEVVVPVKVSGIQEIRKELRQLQFDISQATDPEQMAQMAERAGELRDQLEAADEKARVFASGSKFEQVNNALGLMGSQLMALDFDGAGETAGLFANRLKSINPQEMTMHLKGLSNMVTQIGGAFLKMGATLLMNPIFLIAGAIAGVVAIIGVLLNKLGLASKTSFALYFIRVLNLCTKISFVTPVLERKKYFIWFMSVTF